jgi:hypothetical protein
VIRLLKDFWGLISGLITILLTILLETLDSVELIYLQKTFYISSIILIWIGIYQAVTKHRKMKKSKLIELLLQMEKTNNLVQLANHPEKKGEILIHMYQKIQIGGKKMKTYFKSLSTKQLLSLVITLLLLGLGIASVYVPSLAFVAENIEAFLIVVGLVSGPGILSRGKELGEAVKLTMQSKGRIKEINKLVKLAKKELDLLDVDYGYLKPYVKRIAEYGGELTAEQSIANNNYTKQRLAIEERIKSYTTEAEKLKEDI